MRVPLSRLSLGTVQFGMRYGIANDTGCPSDSEITRVLAVAKRVGIHYLDTARAYGDAENRLGPLIKTQRWGVITKIAPLESFMAANSIHDPSVAVSVSIQQSLEALMIDCIDIAMFHRPVDVELGLDRLCAERDAGRIGAAGVSVYTPEQAIRCLQDSRICHIQIPFNLLDRRWLRQDFMKTIEARPDVVVHARSAFLQGLLLSPASRWPVWVENVEAIVQALDRVVAETGCRNRIELCLRYNASIPWIATTVVGVDKASHLEEIASAATGMSLGAAALTKIADLAALATPRLIDPSVW